MTLIHRIADALHFGSKTAPTDQQTELNIHRQLDRLADSRAMVEYDLAREERLADRLEIAAAQAAATGGNSKALSDKREAVLVRIAELRSAHRALTDAIAQRAAIGSRLVIQPLPADPPESSAGTGGSETADDDIDAEVEQVTNPR